MAELRPAPFCDLVARLYHEPKRQNALFELPRHRWHRPDPGGPDLSVRFHGRRAANPLGPAAGPHTQMAQNLLLSYVAGARILELKTVQVNDRLAIPRPCIDMTNVGYNVEWSQELLVDESAREYAAGWMLIHMFRHACDSAGDGLRGPAGDFLFDLSVGYDLVGIRSDKVRRFLDAMRDASDMIASLRADIPREYAAARELDYPARLSDSITLSTFHGCPADEIERICEFLIGDCGFDVIVKMNPPMLGKNRLEHLLHDVLGYTELTVNPSAYTSGLGFDEGVQLCRRLTRFAAARGRSFGAKFSNTLEVLNHRDFFTPDNKVMYLSGQPLHVITLSLTDEFRRAMGPALPISFSAGIDQQNFPAAVACGFVPITVSTDLLRPGGYGRLPGYLQRLTAEMKKADAANIEEYILRAHEPRAQVSGISVPDAAARNLTIIAEQARNDPRYRAENNRKVPNRLDRHLVTFDCITCDKCLPVCPNAANFTYPTPKVAFDYRDVIVTPGDQGLNVTPGETRRFEINETMQIACYADFCNECGNCDTFCPEYGGPYIKKPTFFGSEASWRAAAPRDGFVVGRADGQTWLLGRIRGLVHRLTMEGDRVTYNDGTIELIADGADVAPRVARFLPTPAGTHRVDLWAYHTMRHLLSGVLDVNRINQVNAAFV
jgi:putative selenate reductase